MIRFTASKIKENGIRILAKGWTPFFARVAPLHCFQMPLYEQIRVRMFGLDYFD